MEKVFYLLLLIFFGPFISICLFRRLRRSRSFRVLIIFLHAVLFTFLTIFFFNRPGWRWSEQLSFIQDFYPSSDTGALAGIRKNFILIDNSGHKEFIPDTDQDSLSKASLAVTDHNKLAILLHLLDSFSDQLDNIIIDIDLTSVPVDSGIRQALQHLYANNKLLLSGNSQSYINDPSIYGNVTEKANQDHYVSQSILSSGNWSLPYLMYEHQFKIRSASPLWWGLLIKETDSSWTNHYATNIFFPNFKLTDEQPLKDGHGSTYYSLGDFLKPDAPGELMINLQSRKQTGLHNNVLIGTFSDNNEDNHETLFGKLHGPVIIFNVFEALADREHYLSLLYILLLFVFYAGITSILLWQGFNETAGKPNPSHRLYILTILLAFCLVVKEEIFYLLLALMLVLVKCLTHHWINIMPLLIYFTAMKASLTYAGRVLQEPSKTFK